MDLTVHGGGGGVKTAGSWLALDGGSILITMVVRPYVRVLKADTPKLLRAPV